jgi:metal-responsive CopG/Arc/MetJ family transcriptional regulator
MQKHEELLTPITVNLGETELQNVKDLMMVLRKNRSEIIRDAVRLMAEVHEYDLSQQKAKEL